MNKHIAILFVLFMGFLSLEVNAQKKENAIIYLLEVYNDGFQIQTFINNEKPIEEKFLEVNSTLTLFELHKRINKLNMEGWKIASTDTYKSK
jgi:hypothetical protein